MARIAGVDLPKDKRMEIALTYIYGIGRTAPGRSSGSPAFPDTRVRTSPRRK